MTPYYCDAWSRDKDSTFWISMQARLTRLKMMGNWQVLCKFCGKAKKKKLTVSIYVTTLGMYL